MPLFQSQKKHQGLMVRSLPATSVLFKAGLRKGDIVVSVNGEPIVDELDFAFNAATRFLRFDVLRRGRPRQVVAERKPGVVLKVDFYQKPILRCANRCIFCFIDQMPPGLRSALYIKDEDLSHSFLNGNYVTLSNATPSRLRKIAAMGLSPLFISVHATDPLVRRQMLGIKKAAPIMEQLQYLRKNGIAFHTQIVVCPGYNDGALLSRTIQDLFSIGKNLLSIAVVPVGLTRFRTLPLTPVSRENAKEICRQVSGLSDRDAIRNGTRRLFCADEFFLKAGERIPDRKYYEEYPQIENGVGLVRQLFEAWRIAAKKVQHTGKHGKRRTVPVKRYLLVTSISAVAALEKIARACEKLRPDMVIHVEPAKNHFFGTSVTVAGLLTAVDVVRTIKDAAKAHQFDGVLLPSVMFNYAGFTLDGYSAKRLTTSAGRGILILSSIEELLSV